GRHVRNRGGDRRARWWHGGRRAAAGAGDPADPLGHHRLGRPGQPDVLRHPRLRHLLPLLQGQGLETDAAGAQRRQGGRLQRLARGDGTRCRGHARVRVVGHPRPGREL
ncbi:MAG: ATP-dependent Clp protease adaptor protein ClpS, partial [uncultured Friedmanniella sp.]